MKRSLFGYFAALALVGAVNAAAPLAQTLKPGQEFSDCGKAGWCPVMVVIPAGSFMMGAPAGEAGRSQYDVPPHGVMIATFAVAKHEVTFALWDACVKFGGCTGNPNPSDQKWGRGSRPVINVSWDDAQQYVQWLSLRTGQRYRLLTEAEWEYAARAGSTTRYAWGDREPACTPGAANGANFSACVDDRTHTVGSYAANAFGLFDMHGNVDEWVEDCWHHDYVGAPTDGSAWLATACSNRMFRGGSWYVTGPPHALRSAARLTTTATPSSRTFNLGFRVARVVAAY